MVEEVFADEARRICIFGVGGRGIIIISGTAVFGAYGVIDLIEMIRWKRSYVWLYLIYTLCKYTI